MSLSDTLKVKDWLKQKHPSRNMYGARLDHNGYSESLFKSEDDICFVCGGHTTTTRHELIRGIANRRISKAYGLWISVCPNCHVRAHKGEEEWQKTAQRMFEHYHTHEDFMALFGENYL